MLGRCSRAWPMIAEIVGVRAVDDDRDSALTRDRRERVPQLRLAEVAAIRRIRGVAWIVHFVRRHLEHRHGELVRDRRARAPTALRGTTRCVR